MSCKFIQTLKHMKKLFIYIFLFVGAVFLNSCNEDDAIPEAGEFTLEFDSRVGDANLQLNTANTLYKNAKNQTFNVTLFQYYISNIKLKREDGTYFEDPMSTDGSKGFYLIKESEPGSEEIVLKNVPAGKYTEVTFTIGVDGSQINQGAQTGALDPVNQMFWSWNAGWIFVAFEGTSPQSTEMGGALVYHTGGYKSDPANANLVNNLRSKTLAFGETAVVEKGREATGHILFDVAKLFASPNQIDFSSNAMRHSPASCATVADNYVNAFTFDHLHND